MTDQELTQAFGAVDITTPQMKKAIKDWYSLYYDDTKDKDSDPCQQIAYTIVRKLTKATFAEYTATSKDDFTGKILDELYGVRNKALQQSLIGGSVLLKPVPVDDGFIFLPVPRNNIKVFGRDAFGNIVDMGTTEESTYGNNYYTLLERRRVDTDGLTITNRLYASPNKNQLGKPVSLTSIPRYENLAEELHLPIDSIGLVALNTPVENCVDGSADSVSIYAKAAGLIHNINHNEALINSEFDNGKSRIIASADMFEQKENGCKKLDQDLFVGIDEDPADIGITVFSPQLREQSFLNRKNEYLRNVESVIGLKRGLLADVQDVERTATEIASSDGDYNLTIIDFQKAWERTAKALVILCGKLGKLYQVSGAKEYTDVDISFDWGNGVLFDPDQTFAEDLDLVARGMLKPEYVIAKRYGMPCDTPADLQKVHEKYFPTALEDDE